MGFITQLVSALHFVGAGRPTPPHVVDGEYEAGYAGPGATLKGYPQEPLRFTRKMMVLSPLGGVVLAEDWVEADLPGPARNLRHPKIEPLELTMHSLAGGLVTEGAVVRGDCP